ncbi:MAG: aminoglycoside phosphotransferase family protein [Micropruina sp.]|uniref:phosphotransferase n=1 Tax=Micropruina sp. TaxID=2737536 RepID=UPI0039E6AA2E
MPDDTVTGVEAALLGPLSRVQIDAWVARAARLLTGRSVARTVLRAGRIDAVYGVQTDEGQRLLVKVHRPPVDLGVRRAVAGAQRVLADAGFPCPRPVAGPASLDGKVVSVETLLDGGHPSSGREPGARRATAAGLAEHLAILREVPGLARSIGSPPAWCDYLNGPWPTPHDSVFDFTRTPAGYEWLDDFARRASAVLIRDRSRAGREVVVGHADWYCGNLQFDGGRLVAAFDWDLMADTAPVVAGLSAGGYIADGAPTPDEVAGYLDDFEGAWTGRFATQDRRVAQAAAAWMIAFNARCDLDNRARGIGDGAALEAVRAYGAEYLR